MSEDARNEAGDLIMNEALSPIFVDNLVVATRVDDIYFLRFATQLPEGLKEQARLMIPEDALKGMLDILCRSCDYFPVKD